MLKAERNQLNQSVNAKQGSKRTGYPGPLASGMNRRAFLRTSSAMALLGGLTACKPQIPGTSETTAKPEQVIDQAEIFNSTQKATLDAVQMQLFPDDGNGPGARDIKALDYLEWAMTDPQNLDDGDLTFILQGIGWLDDLARQTQGDNFQPLNFVQQDKVLKQIAQSTTGENWLALLIYYLTEALLLDPVYGGNPDGIGWQWLEHQAGFPQPVTGKTYRDFE